MELDRKIVFWLVGGFILYSALGYFGGLELALAALLAFAVAWVLGYPAGWLVGHLLARHGDVDARGFRIVAWSNVVGWLFPPLGMGLSAVSRRLARDAITHEGLYALMSFLGFWLAAANATLGALLYLQQPQVEAPGEEIVVASTERSWPRCQFAAIERWSGSDIERYCNDHQPTDAEVREFERLAQEYEAQRPAG